MWLPPHIHSGRAIGLSPRLRRLLGSSFVASAVAALASSCQSVPNTEFRPQAQVMIEGHSRMEVEVRTELLFRQNQWQLAKSAGRDLVFEKPASRMTDLAYGGWFDRTWMRARVRIRALGAEAVAVECEVHRVEDPGHPSLEETKRISKTRKGPYQKLLEEIKASFQQSG